MSIAHQINNLFFNNKILKLKAKMEGQKTINSTFIIGARTGPICSISGLLHEICHFTELEIDRLAKFPPHSWGFKLGSFWQIGQYSGFEPKTSQQVLREARVWAYQLSLEHYLGLNTNPYDLVKSATWLPAFCYYKYSFSGTPSDTKSLYYLAKHVERSAKTFSFNRLINEFNLRINYLQNITN